MFGLGFAELIVVLLALAMWLGLAAGFLVAIYYVVRLAIRDSKNEASK